jgi:hypothetical protein
MNGRADSRLPRTIAAALTAAALLLLVLPAAQAGSSCEERAIGATELRNAMQMAARTRDLLDASGASVAIVGRVGGDLSEHGLRYTHAGIILRDHRDGRWTFVHLLNLCGSDRSAIYDEGLVNFFLDDLFAFEAVVLIPSPALQQRLVSVVNSELSLGLHNPEYSMIANPSSTRYQNSNQWLLEILAAALEPAGVVRSRAQAQAVLTLKGYTADEVGISALKRLGAALTRANVRFDDHDAAETASQRYKVVSVRSLARFLRQVDTPAAEWLVPLDGEPVPPTRF